MLASSDSIEIPQAPAVASHAPRHVLYLFDQLCNLDGGAERSLLKTVQLLPPDRYRASIATFCRPDDISFLNRFPCPIHLLPLKRAYGWSSIKVALLLRDIIQCEQVSVVQTFFASSDLLGGAVARLSGCPVLISSRRDMGFLRQRKHRIGYRLMGSAYDRVHTVSDAVRDYTIQHDRVATGRVLTIPNGVDTERIAQHFDPEFRSRHGLQDASHLIVDVGSIKPVKGYEVLIRAAELVCRQFPKAVFAIAGPVQNRPYFDKLQCLVKSLGLVQNMKFLGNVDPVYPLLHASDIFCHLSSTDGLSNAMLEAMATGLPCVISRVGGNPEVVEEGQSAFIVPPADHLQAADRLIELLTDQSRRQRMGTRSREIVEERFTAEQMVQRFVVLYDQLLDTNELVVPNLNWPL
jgi:glycosyltransferase involved in cell wall biosynthesis